MAKANSSELSRGRIFGIAFAAAAKGYVVAVLAAAFFCGAFFCVFGNGDWFNVQTVIEAFGITAIVVPAFLLVLLPIILFSSFVMSRRFSRSSMPPSLLLMMVIGGLYTGLQSLFLVLHGFDGNHRSSIFLTPLLWLFSCLWFVVGFLGGALTLYFYKRTTSQRRRTLARP